MNDFNPFEQDIADRLQQQARSVDVGDTPLTTVVARGRQRSERKRVVVGLAVVVALSATVIGTIQVLSKPVTHRVAPSTDSVPSDEATPNVTIAGEAPSDDLTPVTRVDSNMLWNPVDPGSAEALGGTTFGSGSTSYPAKPPYLVWSTAPGRQTDPNQSYAPRLWRSDDGIHWQLAGDDTFIQPDQQTYGLGSRNGRLFAFGTAAATAPIPKGGGGDVVVDVSDDQGATWRHITLPVDLRGLAKLDGVQSVGFSGSFVVGANAIVAVAEPYLNFTQAVYDRFGTSGFTVGRDGITPINIPSCDGSGGGSVTTVSGISAAGGTAPADTVVPGTTTTMVATVATGASDPTCTIETLPQAGSLVPWSDMGIDPGAAEAMFTPRVFVSTDGENFVEGTFPAPPSSNFQPGSTPQLFATDNGFIGISQFFDPLGQQAATQLYSSADGMTWSQTDTSLGQISYVQALPDGTLVAFGQDPSPYPNSGSWVATSTDGAEWTKRSMSTLLDPDDGQSAMVNVWQTASGPSGLTVVGNIDVDMAVEAGGFSIEKDGVRLTLTESRYASMVATDVASGEELGRMDGRTPPTADAVLGYGQSGGIRLLNDDGTVRVEFTDQDMQAIWNQQYPTGSKLVILHSTDGINWSRDDVEPLTGFDSYGGGRVQVTDSNVLVSVVKSTPINPDGTLSDPAAIPKTMVLVGTEKS